DSASMTLLPVRQDLEAGQRDLAVAVRQPGRTHARYADAADHLAVEDDWEAAFERYRRLLPQMPEAVEFPGRQVLVENPGGAPERGRAVRLGRREVDAAELPVAHAVQQHHVSAVVADGDGGVPAILRREGFSSGGDLLGELER